MREINEHLNKGHRILWAGNTYEARRHVGERESRTTPKNCEWPNQNDENGDPILYTLENEAKGPYNIDGFKFYYPREGTWNRHSEFEESRRRGAFWVCKSDPFILDFDAASLADIEFYIESRFDRHNYRTSIPLLKAMQKKKLQEREEEKPIRSRVMKELEKGRKVGEANESKEALEQEIEESIQWWKTKNHQHQPLPTQEPKAGKIVRTLTEEIQRRRRLGRAKEKPETQKWVEQILKAEPDTILITLKSPTKAVSLKPASKIKTCPFLHETHWEKGNDNPAKRVEWTLADNQTDTGKIFEGENWAQWPKHIRKNKALTDQEIEESAKTIRERLGKRGESRRKPPLRPDLQPQGKHPLHLLPRTRPALLQPKQRTGMGMRGNRTGNHRENSKKRGTTRYYRLRLGGKAGPG